MSAHQSEIDVLIADDDEDVRNGIARLLTQAAGLQVVAVAGDGGNAARIAADRRPHVAVLDVRMPEGGADGIRRLLSASPGTAVIAYTAHGDRHTRREVTDAGAGWFLVKGSDDSRLLATIQEAGIGHGSPDDGWIAGAFVALANTVQPNFDVVEYLTTLTEYVGRLLERADIGVFIADGDQVFRPVASSTEAMHRAELLEIQHDEGPCVDCGRHGASVLNRRLDEAQTEWPTFARDALGAGYSMVSALPIRLGDDLVGALNIFHGGDVPLSSRDIHLAQCFADVAAIGILQERAFRASSDLNIHLQNAVNSRSAIEQAKGILSQQLGVEVGDAFNLLRAHARATNRRIADVAALVIDRGLTGRDLLARVEHLPPPADAGQQPLHPTVERTSPTTDLADLVVRRISTVAIGVAAASSVVHGPIGERLEEALKDLDELAAEVRRAAFAEQRSLNSD